MKTNILKTAFALFVLFAGNLACDFGNNPGLDMSTKTPQGISQTQAAEEAELDKQNAELTAEASAPELPTDPPPTPTNEPTVTSVPTEIPVTPTPNLVDPFAWVPTSPITQSFTLTYTAHTQIAPGLDKANHKAYIALLAKFTLVLRGIPVEGEDLRSLYAQMEEITSGSISPDHVDPALIDSLFGIPESAYHIVSECDLPCVNMEGVLLEDGTLFLGGSDSVAGFDDTTVFFQAQVDIDSYDITGKWTFGVQGELFDEPASYDVVMEVEGPR